MNFTLHFFVSEGTFINLHYSDVNLSKQWVRSKNKIIGALSYDPLSTHNIATWALHLFQAFAPIATYFQYFQIARLLIYQIYVYACPFFSV